MASSSSQAEPEKNDVQLFGSLCATQYQSRFGLSRAAARLDEPRMLVGGVVDDEVHDQPDAALVQRGHQLVELRERAEQRVDVLVVADVVAVVVHRRAVDRREPDDVDTEPGEVVDVGEDPAEIADPVAVGVGEAARVDLVDDGASATSANSPRHSGMAVRDAAPASIAHRKHTSCESELGGFEAVRAEKTRALRVAQDGGSLATGESEL